MLSRSDADRNIKQEYIERRKIGMMNAARTLKEDAQKGEVREKSIRDVQNTRERHNITRLRDRGERRERKKVREWKREESVKISSILRQWEKRDRCDWFADARPSRGQRRHSRQHVIEASSRSAPRS